MKKKTEEKKPWWLRENVLLCKRVRVLLTNFAGPGINIFFFWFHKSYRDTDLYCRGFRPSLGHVSKWVSKSFISRQGSKLFQITWKDNSKKFHKQKPATIPCLCPFFPGKKNTVCYSSQSSTALDSAHCADPQLLWQSLRGDLPPENVQTQLHHLLTALPPPDIRAGAGARRQEAPVSILHSPGTTPPNLQTSHLAKYSQGPTPSSSGSQNPGQGARKQPQFMWWRHFLSAIKSIIYYHSLFLHWEWLAMDFCSSHPSSYSPSLFPPPPHVLSLRRFHRKEEGDCTLSEKGL